MLVANITRLDAIILLWLLIWQKIFHVNVKNFKFVICLWVDESFFSKVNMGFVIGCIHCLLFGCWFSQNDYLWDHLLSIKHVILCSHRVQIEAHDFGKETWIRQSKMCWFKMNLSDFWKDVYTAIMIRGCFYFYDNIILCWSHFLVFFFLFISAIKAFHLNLTVQRFFCNLLAKKLLHISCTTASQNCKI